MTSERHDPHCGSPSGRVCLNPRCRCRCHLPATRRERVERAIWRAKRPGRWERTPSENAAVAS